MPNSIPQHEQDLFKQAVLQHITTRLPSEDWESFRYHWCMVNQRMDPEEDPNPELTPHQLVNETLTSMRNEVPHLLKRLGKQIEVVGEASGQPIYFAQRAGYYFWSPQPDGGLMLDVNLCFPSYPCGW